MTTFICFAIAMIILYFSKLFTTGFNLTELLSYLIMMAVVGLHVYLSTRKYAWLGVIVPLLIVISFYPVYKLTHPVDTVLIGLTGLYVIAFSGCLYVWYKARKDGSD